MALRPRMGKPLTAQAWREEQDRADEHTRRREEALAELSREIASLVVMCSRRRHRRPSMWRRFINSMTL